MKIRFLKRKLQTEFAKIPLIAVLLFAGFSIFLGLMIAISAGARHPTLYYYLPKGILPIFLMAFFWCLAYGLWGALIGVFLFSCQNFGKSNRIYLFFLFLCVWILSYTWFPVVYRAGSLFLALLLCFLIFFCLFFLFGFFVRHSFLMILGFCLFAFWMIYVFYYTFSLFLLQG